MTWTHLMDMHSGGSLKEKQQHFYIEAPETEAKLIFQNRYGHNPDRVTCTCCGPDYVTYESDTLEEATEYQRQHIAVQEQYRHGNYLPYTEWEKLPRMSVAEYAAQPDVLVIAAEEIKPDETKGTLRQSGYAWLDVGKVESEVGILSMDDDDFDDETLTIWDTPEQAAKAWSKPDLPHLDTPDMWE